MKRDIRDTPLYGEALAAFERFKRPGSGQICDAGEINAAPCGDRAVFSGALFDRLEGSAATRICRVDLGSADVRVMTFGPNTDRTPKYSPDGRSVAFLSDRHRSGDFQLYLMDSDTGSVAAAPRVPGWVEYLHWSPNGERILLGVAGHGADISAGQGAITSAQADDRAPGWMPTLESGAEGFRWRHAYVYDPASPSVRRIGAEDCNVWEACWCGDEAIAAIVSSGPGEGLWYAARLVTVSLAGRSQLLYQPQDQLGWPSASPSGAHFAVVEAVCSDRWIVAGDVRLIDTGTGSVERIDTAGIDVTFTEWRSENTLLLAGHRGFETVIGLFDKRTRHFRELWGSDVLTTGGRYVTASGLNEAGDCVLVAESFFKAPMIARIEAGELTCVRDLQCDRSWMAPGCIDAVTWKAPDGLDIQGWLLRPKTADFPCPVVMDIHGGPVWHWRPRWLGRADVYMLMLLERGYAIFLPNPRGSSGRGQGFARRVVGDMGGADTYDYLSGLDYLVERDVADPTKLGVTGGSYGGFMTSWLITQDERFAAAVSLAQVSNHVSEHLASNIPHFVKLFLAEPYTHFGGKYFERSPVFHAHKVKTPTLNVCGALDRCTPAAESVQFHNALRENGVTSALLTYPEEGHGIRRFPAAIDFTARLVSWFETHIAAARTREPAEECAP